MLEPQARLYLVSPAIADAEAFAPQLALACESGNVAAVLLRLAREDERSLIKKVKALAPLAQDRGAAVLVAVEGDADLATVVTRGGAEGAHLSGGVGEAQMLRQRLKDRTVGAGGLRSKDDAMSVGETGVDYVMFGEPGADGAIPPLEGTIERAAWWAEIFVTPCVAFAATLDAVGPLAATGAEFVALGDAAWHHPKGAAAAVRAALDALSVPEKAG